MMENSIETTDTVTEVADDIAEVETNTEPETTGSDVDNMSDEEFAEFEADAFNNNETDSDEDSEGDDASEPTAEDLDELYKSQMADTEAKLDKPIVIKVAGKVYKVDSIGELKNLAELGTSSTQKFQAIAKHRKTLDYMEDNDISQEDLDYLVQSRGGAPVKRDDSVNAVEDIASNILSSPGAEAFQTMAAQLPDDVKSEMSTNPRLLAGFNADVQSGLAQKIMPLVSRFMNVNQMTFMQAYQAAGDKVSASNAVAPEPVVITPDVNAEKMKTLQSQPKPRASVSAGGMSREDMDKMSDADFEKYYATAFN